MALNKLKYNSLNLTPAANKAIGFDSDADALEATLSGGSMTFIKKLTASSSSTLSFVDGSSDVVLDSTYKEYIFMFRDIHPSGDGAHFSFNFSVDGGSNYNVTKTSTMFYARHDEADSATALNYNTSGDIAQGTGIQTFARSLGNDNDASAGGFLHLFEPSSTTFVKHYKGAVNYLEANDYTYNTFLAGYGNTTSAINAVQFKFDSGNFDQGTITLYGIN